MAHPRPRHVVAQFLRRLRFARVVSIQGARQTGKSFLAREILTKKLHQSQYISLDERSHREFAIHNPSTFLKSHLAHPLIIDEAQKAPPLFDAIKLLVDEVPKPGQFALLGSTEFSREVQIRESLTGRLSRVRLFSLNIAEGEQLPPNPSSHKTLMNVEARVRRVQLIRHLERGGLPGIFSIRENQWHTESIRDWINLTAERDIHQFPKQKLSTELCKSVLEQLALIEVPSAANIAKKLNRDTRVIQRLLNCLEILFVVHRLSPHLLSTGKPLYFLCDPALVHFYGGPYLKKLWTWALHEQMSQRSYRGDLETTLSYYRTTKGSLIHLVLENKGEKTAIRILDSEKWDKRNLELLHAFREKCEARRENVSLAVMGPNRQKVDGVEFFPWEAMG